MARWLLSRASSSISLMRVILAGSPGARKGALFHGCGIHALVSGSEGDPVVIVDACREFVKDVLLIPAQIGGGDAASEMFGAHGFHSACDQFWLDVPHQGGELGHAIFHWGTGEQQRILALCDH